MEQTLVAFKKSIELETGIFMFVVLKTTYAEFLDKENGKYHCEIKLDNKDYFREFELKNFNQKHFDNFLKKFKKNIPYRKKWEI